MSARGAPAAAPAAWFQLRAAADRVAGWSPVPVLAAFVLTEWLCVLGLALVVRHNGWTYYQGGDQLWYYSLGWLLSHGHLYQTPVGYLWSSWLAPIAGASGPNVAAAYPAVILLNVLVLLPVAMVALYVLASRLAGRLFAYWTLALWIALPFIGVLYTNAGYHERYTEVVLPQALGLTAMADFPTLVAAIVSLAFCARATLSTGPVSLFDAAASGVAAGAAVALKPSVALLLFGPILALVARRASHAVLCFAAGMAPALLTLALWKERGLGQLPLLATPRRVPEGLAAASPVVGFNLNRYFGHVSWHMFISNLDLLREHFWSGRLIEWLVVAGLIGVLRISGIGFVLVAGAFLPFVIVKSSYIATIEDTSLFRILIPAFPLFVLCIAALPFLVPRMRRPSPSPPTTSRLGQRARLALLAGAITATAVLPAVAVAAARRTGPPTAAVLPGTEMPIPVDVDLGLHARVRDGRVFLNWDAQRPPASRVFYRVWRTRTTPGDGLTCTNAEGAANCTLRGTDLGTTWNASASDRPPRGVWVYRVGVAANWLNDVSKGDVYLASTPVTVRVR